MSTSLTPGTPATSVTDRRVLRVQKSVEVAFESTPSNIPCVADLAQQVRLSRWRLQHLFKSQTGLTIKQYVKGRAMRMARQLIAQEGLTMKEVAFALGYTHPANFTRDFKRWFGTTPSGLSSQHNLQRNSTI